MADAPTPDLGAPAPGPADRGAAAPGALAPAPASASTRAAAGLRVPLLFLTVFVIAACGLVYELVAGALASYLLGDSITQFSTVIGAYLSALGLGAWLSRYLPDRDLARRLVEVELAVALCGGARGALLFR